MSKPQTDSTISIAQTWQPAVCVPDAFGHCITCSDQALPARVLKVDGLTREAMALVVLDEQEREVDISLVDGVAIGDVLLVHGGVALGKEDVAR